MLRNKNKNWIDHLQPIITKYNNQKLPALKDIKPNQVSKTENNNIVYDINVSKAKKTISKSDLVIGDQVEVSFNLNGREWVNPKGESKFFNTLDVWKISKIGSNAIKDAQGQGFEPKKSVIAEVVESSDLPF